MCTSSSARRRTNWLEIVLWILIFLLVYLIPSLPHLGFRVEGAEGLIPQLPAASSWMSRLIGLLALILVSGLAIYTGERYLLIEKGERATMVLFFVALMTTSPSLGALSGLAVIFLQLILFLSFGLYQDTHQPRFYLFIGLLVGLLCLLTPLYGVLLPIILLAQYRLRSMENRSLVGLIAGVFLPVWILISILIFQGFSVLTSYEKLLLRDFPLPLPREVSGMVFVSPLCYWSFVACFLVGGVLYRRRFYRENVRHRDMFAVLHFYPLVLLLLVPFVAAEAPALLQLTVVPIGFIVARGMGAVPERMGLVMRAILLALLLGQYLYTLGVFDLVERLLSL